MEIIVNRVATGEPMSVAAHGRLVQWKARIG